MDVSALEAVVYDPSKCIKLSMEQKRELVYEVSKWPDCAMEMLQVWSRQEILQILCAELGKERKYTGLTKSKIIEQLLKLVCERKSQELGAAAACASLSQAQPSLESGERTPKRQRKSDAGTVTSDFYSGNTLCCKNSACKAKMNGDDPFCKRCSCCICRQYDDNKDPSLWLTCSSDPPFLGISCGTSCHLECALRHEYSGISQDRLDKGLDGSFCCVSCGKVNDLLSNWRKQIMVARDTRRVDILCYRLSLSQKILSGTKHYKNLYAIIDEAVKMLEEEVGHLTGLPVKKARGIVNRLSSGLEIQRLCASAVEALDAMLANRVSDMPSDWNTLASNLVRFEGVKDTSLSVIVNFKDSRNIGSYTVWHRRADDIGYPCEPTCRLLKPNAEFILSGLTPATPYYLKAIAQYADRDMGFCEFQFCTESSQDEVQNTHLEEERSRSQSLNLSLAATNCSSLSNPSSVEDETNNVVVIPSNADKPATPNEKNTSTTCAVICLLDGESSMEKKREETSTDDGSNTSTDNNGSNTPLRAGLPITPCLKDDTGRSNWAKFGGAVEMGMVTKRSAGEKKECGGMGDKDFEYYVKVIRWLECEGHIETAFRQKFLTWYGLRANAQEVRIVKVFVDTFIQDPESLAGQLLDSFSDAVANKRCSTVAAGFCTKLWH
ncbi:VIN3-like protein 2 [Andrographis paniculata]|uniref:VIN3-like protein 2 n=1 Tax=Andrographis paniculata TaxID=175694 RepID=UPI0021E8E737|nr:VIN3-like protein 2 [Andrographis paniculata]XP_051149043.1 VIN3-like protein 2 [Andrographis paniculata]